MLVKNKDMGWITETLGESSGLNLPEEAFIKTVEWDMLDKSKFIPMSMASSFTIRCFLYPLTLIRTRLQVQKGNEVYSGTWDAGRKILKQEGFRNLYRGFFVSCFQVVSGICYVSTYEGVRHILGRVSKIICVRLCRRDKLKFCMKSLSCNKFSKRIFTNVDILNSTK